MRGPRSTIRPLWLAFRDGDKAGARGYDKQEKTGGCFCVLGTQVSCHATWGGGPKRLLRGGVSVPYAGRNLLGSPGPIGWHVTRAVSV